MADRDQRARVFGSAAGEYARHRPTYAPAAIRWALSTPGLEVLDLGAGTGKLTEGLVEFGATVRAVDPDESMLAELTARFPDVSAQVGTAERIPLPDASVDAVVVGQAMHWFDLDVALPEIARVLRPGGVLAPFWNVVDDRVEWTRGYLAATEEVSGYSTSGTLRPFHHELFGEFELAEFANSHRRTAEELVATVATQSGLMILPPERRRVRLERVLAYLRGRPETASGEFDLPMVTVARRSRLV